MKPINDELDPGAVPGGSTISTYAGYADSILRHKKRQVCVYDGAELRIDRRNRERGVTGRRDRKSANTTNANENFALAA